MNKSDVWKRDKQQIMAKIQADAEANNEPLSEDVLEMIELVLDMENKAYEAGYKKGLAAGDAVEFGFQCKCLEVLYKYYENEGRKAKRALNDLMRVG